MTALISMASHSPIKQRRCNRDKRLNNLMGILDGIIADNVIDDREVVYLDAWLKAKAGKVIGHCSSFAT